MHVELYSEKYHEEAVTLILDIQNNEAKIGLSLEEQPDLLHIDASYREKGGAFWLALEKGEMIGTLGLMRKEQQCAVMKKLFVKKEFRSQKVGAALYKELLAFAKETGIRHILLDTPSVAHASHRFLKKPGSAAFPLHSCPFPIPIRTETACCICLSCNHTCRKTPHIIF